MRNGEPNLRKPVKKPEQEFRILYLRLAAACELAQDKQIGGLHDVRFLPLKPKLIWPLLEKVRNGAMLNFVGGERFQGIWQRNFG